MTTLWLAVAVFAFGYLLNIFYITVLYHRALTHGAVKLTPFSTWLLANTGNWVTGLDPKSWACMHRQHHLYSDTEQDPHSPAQLGVLGVGLGQLRSYERTLRELIKRNPRTSAIVADVPFGVNALNRKRLWMLPYMLHVTLSFVLAFALAPFLAHAWVVGLAYYLGIMSHPIQGWMVNALGHRYGYRNYATSDQSKNNAFVALFVFGEGYQNNHHEAPASANFAHRWFEIDLGYALCQLAIFVGLLERQSHAAPLRLVPRKQEATL